MKVTFTGSGKVQFEGKPLLEARGGTWYCHCGSAGCNYAKVLPGESFDPMDGITLSSTDDGETSVTYDPNVSRGAAKVVIPDGAEMVFSPGSKLNVKSGKFYCGCGCGEQFKPNEILDLPDRLSVKFTDEPNTILIGYISSES